MKTFLAFTCLLCSCLFSMGQGEKVETPRDILCEMSKIEIPKVADLKAYCTRLYALFPSPQEVAKFPIKQKLYVNKLGAVLKRGQTWETMTVQQRSALAKQTIAYVTTYYGYEAGMEIKQPDGFKQSGDPCLLRKVEYKGLAACYSDNQFIVLGEVTDLRTSKIEKFWEVLHYISRKLDCDSYMSAVK